VRTNVPSLAQTYTQFPDPRTFDSDTAPQQPESVAFEIPAEYDQKPIKLTGIVSYGLHEVDCGRIPK
jgi:hypothetical protein